MLNYRMCEVKEMARSLLDSATPGPWSHTVMWKSIPGTEKERLPDMVTAPAPASSDEEGSDNDEEGSDNDEEDSDSRITVAICPLHDGELIAKAPMLIEHLLNYQGCLEREFSSAKRDAARWMRSSDAKQDSKEYLWGQIRERGDELEDANRKAVAWQTLAAEHVRCERSETSELCISRWHSCECTPCSLYRELVSGADGEDS